MARTRNPAVHAVRRDAFVDAAQRLIQTKGYEEMSIQDVLDELDASRGAFYHYFVSKADLLEAVIERMIDARDRGAPARRRRSGPVGHEASLTRFFGGIARWKGERTELLLRPHRCLAADDNAIVREKFRQRRAVRIDSRSSPRSSPRARPRAGSAAGEPETRRARPRVARSSAPTRRRPSCTSPARPARSRSRGRAQRWPPTRQAFERILGLPGELALVDRRATLRQWFG